MSNEETVKIIQVAAIAAIDTLRSQGVHVCGEDMDKIYSGIFDAIQPAIQPAVTQS